MTQRDNGAVPVRSVTNRDIIGTARAIRVVEAPAGARIRSGFSRPISILTEADLKENGGRYNLDAGEPMLVVVRTTGSIIDGPAMPVFPVDVNGDFDAGFGS